MLKGISVFVEEKPEMVFADKLESTEPITKADLQSLNLYNDVYIDKLLNSGQAHLKRKMAAVVVHLLR